MQKRINNKQRTFTRFVDKNTWQWLIWTKATAYVRILVLLLIVRDALLQGFAVTRFEQGLERLLAFHN